jgi:type III pantothenate kinase
MNVDVVVDAGNSFIKWGRCAEGKVVEMVSLDPALPDTWRRQLDFWKIKKKCNWIITGSNSKRRKETRQWLEERKQQFQILESHTQIPIEINVHFPEKVGLDRLFNAVAVNSRKPTDAAAVIIDAGTAVTVDYLDETGVFQGGAILPGFWTMSRLLHRQTSSLPMITAEERKHGSGNLKMPGKSTVEALALGISACFYGGVRQIIWELVNARTNRFVFFVGGGDAEYICTSVAMKEYIHWPEMTLEGIRIAAERLE